MRAVRTRIVTFAFVFPLIIGLILTGCRESKKDVESPSNKAPAPAIQTKTPGDQTESPEPPRKEVEKPVAVVEMENGKIFEIQLFLKEAPITAGNFIKLVQAKFYDGLIFHRVEPGFVAQTGDPTGTGRGGPGYTIQDEPTPFKHEKGAVGMAKTSQPNSAGSQWYICLEDAHFLDGRYTVFGKVIKGMENVEQIKVGDRIKQITIRN